MSNLHGVALKVEQTGKISQVLFNDLEQPIQAGMLFPTILSNGEFAAALDFINRLKTEKMLVDVPLSIDINQHPKSFYFTGVQSGNDFILVASNNQGLDASIYDEIAKVNNELANQVRESVKAGFTKSTDLTEPQLDEFTKLNNELVNIQRELNKSNQTLEVLNRQKNEMIGIAAHDLRNPLGVISGYIQFVKGTATNLNDGQIQMLDKAIETASKMTDMLEELLDMSELDSGKVMLKVTKADIDKLIKENIELNQVIAAKKDIDIHYDSTGSLLVDMDAPKIEQVVNNFISNAIKYSHPKTNIYVSLKKLDQELKVCVKDEGQGIPKDELHKVFEPFKTTSVKSTGGEKSTGLGLAITKKVIEAHKGVIGVESQVDKGTTFYFTLPLSSSLNK